MRNGGPGGACTRRSPRSRDTNATVTSMSSLLWQKAKEDDLDRAPARLFVGEGHVQSAAQEELNRILEPQPFGERLPRPDERLGRIQHRYMAAVSAAGACGRGQ